MEKLGSVLGTISGIAALILDCWVTYVMFAGGDLPIVGHVDGGVNQGVWWLLLGTPVLLTVAYMLGMLVALPIVAIAALLSKDEPPGHHTYQGRDTSFPR